jgi:hypothetical protein
MTVVVVGDSGAGLAPTQGAGDAQGKQPDERRSAAEVLPILPVEGAAVAQRVLGGPVLLGPAGAALPLASPAHDVAVAREAETMAQQPAAQHRGRAYSARGRWKTAQ